MIRPAEGGFRLKQHDKTDKSKKPHVFNVTYVENGFAGRLTEPRYGVRVISPNSHLYVFPKWES